jgi:hypothetical protein
MGNLIGYCGIDCSACPAYIAKKTDDLELRKKTAIEWTAMFSADFSPEDINCDGCIRLGQHINYCSNLCEIRKCAMDKNVENCAYCREYACAKLQEFLNQVPDAAKRLDEIKKRLGPD